MRCPSCGADHRADQRFCEECGAALREGAAAAAAQSRADDAERPAGDPELRLAAVLFVDLVGFTSLSESREPEDVRELLSGYFDSARTIIERYGGVIEKFIGDAVMAVWGVPKAHESDAERAVRAALEIVDAVQAFGDTAGAPGLLARAGVVTGQVAAMASRDEGIVVGDRVNTAARVQTAAEPGSVLVDETTRQVTSAAIAYEDAGEHELKGKDAPERLWRPRRVVGGRGGALREAGLEAPLVGRAADLRLVKDLFHAGMERGVARLVALSGPAGVGKTRLAREFDNYTDGLADDFFVHAGRCLPYGEGVAYWALAEMVRQRFGIPEEAGADEASAKLNAGLDSLVEDPADRAFLLPRLGALIGVAEPGLARDELFAGWRMLFERLAEQDPVVLTFEDMQWADDGLLDFIDHLLEWSTDAPIFMLVLARPELSDRRGGWPGDMRGATVIHLEPLSDGAIEDLLDGLVRDLPSEAKARIVSQSGGIPLYAIETIRALADRGDLVEQGDCLALAGELGDLDTPATLSSLLAARLDSLAPEERDVVRTMSVFGGAFPLASAAALTGMAEEPLHPILQSLVRKQVFAIRADPLSPNRGQYAFAQSLLRNVAYDMLSRRERKARHAAVARHLREAFPDEGEDVAEVIAAHCIDAYDAAAGDDDADELRRAAMFELRRGAHRAATVGAPQRAEQAYLKALELTDDDDEDDRLQLMEDAAQMARRAAHWEAAIELYESLLEIHRAAGRVEDVARVVGQMNQPMRNAGRGEEALERMRAAFAEVDATELSAGVAELNEELASALALSGQPDEAQEPLDRALLAGEALELRETFCLALTTQAFVYGYAGRVEQERGLYRVAIDLADRHDLTQVGIVARANLAESLAQTDEAQADAINRAGLAACRRIGERRHSLYIAGNTMHRYFCTGRWAEIDALASELLDDGGGEVPEAHYLHLPLVFLALARGRLGDAASHAARLDGLREGDDFEFVALCQGADAGLALAEGRADDAHDLAMAALAETPRLGGAHEAIRVAWPRAVESALALGRTDVAASLIAELERRPPGFVPPLLRAELCRNRARLAAALGEGERSERDFAAAVRIYEELDYPYLLAQARADLGEWLAGNGRPAEAQVLLGAARETLRQLGVKSADEPIGEPPASTRGRTPA